MEIVCRRWSNRQKQPWFGKSYCFACLMGYFPGSCSRAIKSSIPRCICSGRVAQTVLAWQISHLDSEPATRGVLSKKVFLKISQNSSENTCIRVSVLIKLLVSACNFIKKRFWHRCFPMNSAKFSRARFLQNTSGRLLLLIPQSQWVYIAMGCSFL